MKALEETVSHLMSKVTNSKGGVKIPLAKLIEIFHSDNYLSFTNLHVKSHGKNRIFDFIFASYKYIPRELESDMVNLFVPIMRTLGKLSDQT